MSMSRDDRFAAMEAALSLSFGGEIKIGGNYVSVIRHDNQVYVSGQIPRVGDTVIATGRVGTEVSLEQARYAAKVCTMRALALLRHELGSLDRVSRILRITVFVKCSEDFSQHSEVADGASELLHSVLGDAGIPTRTSVGVYQLPKNAPVEIDLIAAVDGCTDASPP
ncbi:MULTISPECIES: RidA family protein [Comamonas]|jgi:enamine deaminase RidA (YjgF/YER057c/UK114 family)|uniref:RidA family protein n=1 Tax=Comamonas TaxID=283 RepID=UPI00283F5865|nr:MULTISPECIES: RidA family protein [Comamonas]MDR3066913.1 RidA family protein [Comamonas sp.]MEB5967134.1 RidA family protein [Comamonas testosteroni]